jgi:methionyl aminopeptidase
MTISSEAQLRHMQAIGAIVAEVLKRMGGALEPGMTTAELDALGRGWLEAHGARSAPELAYNFPGATCISVNHQVAHGVPGALTIAPGDMVNIDVSAERDGYFSDTGASFIVPPAAPSDVTLCRATRRALKQAVASVKPGAKLNQIGRNIEQVARRAGLTVVRNLGSHGVGHALHEAPGDIMGYYEPRDTRVMREGMVFTVEPFLSNGAMWADESDDGWTLVTPPHFRTAQYEHTLVVTRNGPLLLTVA